MFVTVRSSPPGVLVYCKLGSSLFSDSHNTLWKHAFQPICPVTTTRSISRNWFHCAWCKEIIAAPPPVSTLMCIVSCQELLRWSWGCWWCWQWRFWCPACPRAESSPDVNWKQFLITWSLCPKIFKITRKLSWNKVRLMNVGFDGLVFAGEFDIISAIIFP